MDAKQRTPQGGLRIDANLTRTGIFTYRDAGGKEVREYRSPEEVFKADSLQTLHLAPIVIGHPAMVGPDNWQRHSVGTIGEDVRADGKFIVAKAVVQDRKTIDGIEAKRLCELSCGYEVDLVHTPGVTPEGEHYDALQTNIRYNHVGIGPAGWGRAGGEVRLRLDGNGDVVLPDADPVVPTVPGMLTAEQEKARADKAEADLKTATARAEKLEGERDAEKTRADAADKARTDAAVDVPALVAARSTLEMSARKVLGSDAVLTVKGDGIKTTDRPMTDNEIVIAVIAKGDPTFKVDGRSADYLSARFDSIVERSIKVDAAHGQLGAAITDAAKGGSTGKSSTELAQEKVDAANAEAGKAGPPKGALVKKS